ncbi:transcriptional regulator, TrmB [Pyrolobus fumarii 1A]|uniref:Transcriptional regulator, TrmB n=1 Tax=Pyrolobus fumarii (strain DSM 11204 / 1A) TaxID=694429 RepID=G0EFH2_PYRF1|nr:helix-turn-helix domain-containing protein [Pyrolobus fumarii]AEM38996.1 transcriptional regulator, TrmB [Pyrolobus fumarii 1A]
MEEQLVSELIELGLNRYEARAYIALLRLGEAPASTVAEAARIPLTRVYDVLSSLEEKGLVMVIHQRPKLYKAVEPRLALSNLVGYLEARFREELDRKRRLADALVEKLASVEPYGSSRGALDTVIIRGEAAVRSKAAEILGRASRSVRVAGYRPFLVINCLPAIEHLARRGVRLLVLGELTEKCIEVFERYGIAYRRYPFTYSSMMIVDDEEILIVLNPGREMIALYSTNRDLVRAHVEFFERLWREASTGTGQ